MKLLESEWIRTAANQIVGGINHALAMSPGSQKHLKHLENCTFHIHIKGLDTDFYFGVANTAQSTADKDLESTADIYTVKLVEVTDRADAKISGSPISFIKLFSQKNKAVLFQSKELTLEGDSIRIQQILAFISSLQIDWDGLLSTFIGDIPAHFMGSSLRSGLLWGMNFSQSLIRDTEEFIKFELRLLPDKRRAKNQFSAISSLAVDLDKLTARFEKFEAKTNKITK